MTADSVSSCPSRLGGKVAIVAGGGRGIGRAVALALADQGASVVVASRTAHEVDETCRMLAVQPGVAVGLVADVTDQRSVESLVNRTIERFGAVDVLVDAAGTQGPIGPLVDNDVEEWIGTVRVNLVGSFLCCKAVLPHMIDQRGGKIILFSGGGATSPRPHFSAYGVSKTAVVRLVETLAEEVKQHNIQVNAIAPGAVNTRMLEEILAAGKAAGMAASAEARRQLETGGAGTGLAASLAVFLASDESAGLTGKLIAAPHDDWQSWDSERIEQVMSTALFTLRRMDVHTVRPLLDKLVVR